MRVLLDTCVIYPTVLREILLGVARAGLFTPLWSASILREWRTVAEKRNDAALAEGEIARLTADWPDAELTVREAAPELWLPDPADTHVLAAAIDGAADVLLTYNLRDFPARELAPRGIRLRHPDPFLCDCLSEAPDAVAAVAVAEAVRAKAEALSGAPQPMRPLLKRARVPRFARALERL